MAKFKSTKILSSYVGKMQQTEKSGDISKYNLRCNRSVSEKMTQKDFIYDIRIPVQHSRKFADQARSSTFPVFNKDRSDELNMLLYDILPWNDFSDGVSRNFAAQRCLEFECNYCREPIATLFSLSTHVKSHCREYCKTCYWILDKYETMKQHVKSSHKE